VSSDLLRSFVIPGGIQLAVERMPGTRSVSTVCLLPVGCAGDPAGAAGEGEAPVLAELLFRGADGMSSRAWSDAMDTLGAQRHAGAGTHQLTLSALCLGDRLPDVMRLLSLAIRRPNLDTESLDAARSLVLQSLRGLRDEPQHLASVMLREHAMPAPFNRSGYGTEEGLTSLTAEGLRASWHRRALPTGTFIGIAGDVDPAHARDLVEGLFEGWTGSAEDPPVAAPARLGTHLVELDTQQTHLALGFPAPPDRDADAVAHRVAVRVLGGATSSRLFTEVREKRGLCYSVGASSALGRDRGLLQIYAGSTHERAHRTLECIQAELERFERGITADEFADAIVGAKSALVMSGESSGARASAIAGQLWRLGRPKDLGESAAEFDRLTHAEVNRHIERHMGASWRAARTLVMVAPSAPATDAAGPVTPGA
jgi:predicted Zn-dependent peptidase